MLGQKLGAKTIMLHNFDHLSEIKGKKIEKLPIVLDEFTLLL